MRTKFNFPEIEGRPDFILAADIHVRETIPSCRTDTFLKEMQHKLSWLKELSDNWLGVPTLGAGDIFDSWKCKDWWLANLAHKTLPEQFICIAGQHELPRHSLKLPERSPLNILHDMGRIHLLSPGESLIMKMDSGLVAGIVGKNWGDERPPTAPDGVDRAILLNHELVWKKIPFPGAPPTGNARRVLSCYPDFDLIVCGDNHVPFTMEKDGRLLVNCGPMLRTAINQRELKPCVWLYYSKTNKAVPFYFPIQDSFHEYETVEDNQYERIAALVKRLNSGSIEELNLTFSNNLRMFLATEKTPRRVEEILLETIGE